MKGGHRSFKVHEPPGPLAETLRLSGTALAGFSAQRLPQFARLRLVRHHAVGVRGGGHHRHRHRLHLVARQALEALAEAHQLGQGVEAGVGGEAAGDRVGDRVELGGVGEEVRRGDLLQQGLHQLLLEADTAQVAAVAYAVPGAGEREGLLAVEVVGARLQLQVAVVVVDVLVRGDGDPAERVHELREAREVDLDVVVHADVGDRLDRLDRAHRSAHRVGAVEHRVVRHRRRTPGRQRAGRAGDERVARDADDGGLGPAGVEVDDHRRVGAGAARCCRRRVPGSRCRCASPSRGPGC